jgi:hypothetical protein
MFFWILVITAFVAALVGITVVLVRLSAGTRQRR